MLFLIFSFFALNILAQQDSCALATMEVQQLLKNYNFIEMEKKLEESIKICPIEQYQNLYHQLALVYIWREKYEKAKPIIDKITAEAEYKQTQIPSVQALGKGRMLNIIYFNLSDNKKEIENEINNFNDLNFKAQEALFFYFLRKNDKRFFTYYGMRRQVKGDLIPFLCKVYCKKNNIIKDCPCQENIEKKFEGGVYYILQSYLNGEDLNSLKEKIEKYYKDVPGLKKELFEILNIK